MYDVQDESSRTDVKRPFRYRELMDPSWFAGELTRKSNKQCVVYKAAPCMASPAAFEAWLDQCVERDRITAVNVVGAPSSAGAHSGPTTKEASAIVQRRKGVHFGGVCIAERHVTKKCEHVILDKKSKWGADWFITQGIYDPEPMISVIKEYGALCREQGTQPKKIILTFTPCGRRKTMDFIKWLGMQVTEEAERAIFGDEAGEAKAGEAKAGEAKVEGKAKAAKAAKPKPKRRVKTPLERSCDLMCANLTRILDECHGSGVPLGLNVESVSGYRDEIDATHDLFRALQSILLDRGPGAGPWMMAWSRLPSVNKLPSLAVDNRAAIQANRAAIQDNRAAVIGPVAITGGVSVGLFFVGAAAVGALCAMVGARR